MSIYSVVDIFADPGGLAEGFSSVRSANGKLAFKIALSIDADVEHIEINRMALGNGFSLTDLLAHMSSSAHETSDDLT